MSMAYFVNPETGERFYPSHVKLVYTRRAKGTPIQLKSAKEIVSRMKNLADKSNALRCGVFALYFDRQLVLKAVERISTGSQYRAVLDVALLIHAAAALRADSVVLIIMRPGDLIGANTDDTVDTILARKIRSGLVLVDVSLNDIIIMNEWGDYHALSEAHPDFTYQVNP